MLVKKCCYDTGMSCSASLSGPQYRRFGEGNVGKCGQHDGKAPVVVEMPS
jgi:hypothetical protein